MWKKLLLTLVGFCLVALLGLNLWGAITLGTTTPDPDAERSASANQVAMVFGATGSVGDGLLKAVIEDDEVDTIYAVTRRLSPRLKAGQASGRVTVIMQEDFTDYSGLASQLARVNTVLWGLGTTSIGMDAELYRHIHEDFPVAFVKAWLDARSEGPMAFHYVTGMGTGEEQRAQWARDKGRAERRIAELAQGSGLRTFGHRSGWIRPASEDERPAMAALALLVSPGHLVIKGTDLGRAMLEISARVNELGNGAVIDNRDALKYAAAYRAYQANRAENSR